MTEPLLPLFPLKVVLFPSTELPLHIFEERYKEMIGECLEHRSEFGVVLVLEEGLASTGCTAAIAEVLRRFDDGRMDILVRGQRRFELVRLDQEKSYLRGEAQYFDDEDALPGSDARRKQASELYEQIAAKLASEGSGNPPLPPDPAEPQLSFQIVSRLPVELTFRQTLLQLRSESERIDRVITYLEKMALRVTLIAQAQARAGGNGRSR